MPALSDLHHDMDLYEHYSQCPLIGKEEYVQVFEGCKKYRVSCLDITLSEPEDLASSLGVDLEFAQQFQKEIIDYIDSQVSFHYGNEVPVPEKFTTGDQALDRLLNGGISTRCVTEIAGESGTGKSNILTQLSLSVQLPKSVGGLDRCALYISTEMGLETRRMFDMQPGFAHRYGLKESEIPTGERIHCYLTKSLEQFENLIKYQLPLVAAQLQPGLIVIDSIAYHYRMENVASREDMAPRSKALAVVCKTLRQLAEKHNTAIVCSNQVSERFIREYNPADGSQQAQYFYNYEKTLCQITGWKQPSMVHRDHQAKKRRYENMGLSSSPILSQAPTSHSTASQRNSSQDVASTSLASLDDLACYDRPRVPFLGLQWAYFIDQRIVLKRYTLADGTRRTVEVVFSSECAPGLLEFTILKEGVFMIVYE